MRELAKIRSVVGKANPGSPDEVLLVLDATNGRNVLSQLKAFDEAVGVTGIAMTKLDGTAKGGTLLALFDTRRPTRDVDLAAVELERDAQNLHKVVNDVLAAAWDDGLTFDLAATTVETIRENDVYPSTRAKIEGRLATARIRFHVDINIGDPLFPAPQRVAVPRLLGGDPILLLGYRIELVLAEKIVTAIQRGTANTRWRDFVDIASLAAKPHNKATLRSSIATVAAHRLVELRPLVEALSGYAEHAQPRWAAWRRKHQLSDTPEAFADLLDDVVAFTDPLLYTVDSRRETHTSR